MNEEYVEIFKNKENLLEKVSPSFMMDLRHDAITHFGKTGLPGEKDELYKYTSMQKVFEPHYSMLFQPSAVDFNVDDIFTCDVPNLGTRLEVILNGFYLNRGSSLTKLENGIMIGSLAEALKQYPDLVKDHYAKHAGIRSDGLVALNTAFALDGLFIYVPKGQVLDTPIQIVHLPMTGLDTLLHYRNLFVLEENAQAEVIVCDHTLSPFRFLTNAVTEIYAGRGANFHYSRIQNEHLNSNLITNLFIHQEADSYVNSNTASLHGGLIRNNTQVLLNGEGCENETFGLFFADRNQHIDNYVNIDHARPNCTSTQLFKGILDDQATGAFNGRILVRQDAQKTLAYQTNNNILMSDEAKMNSKPQLEIYADDVKCSHGATTGQLDENALFYMQSRGIPRQEARLLMLYAFAHEVIDNIKVKPLKERMIYLVDKRLRGELSRCNNCSLNKGELPIPK
ncbi:MAG: Fe-S cluster assembly protein SufD [Bacteroidales bacterium]|nr:Fe-S cluster assembly protein SufD [Bacteroidales bacterium]